ncbi:MAG: c-type cytochrome biogenesis protein CcmI [Azonexus sp.]|jgi:cytochrome c-type biogenesis protein CcmI|nr:c-type cytochrome biogenesis protein CcmI [Azonexus sp.]
MTPFVLYAALIVAVVCACLFFPLWFAKRANAALTVSAGNDRQSANLAFFHDQLADLEREHQTGTLSAADFAEARQELQRRLLEEADPAAAPGTVNTSGVGKITAILLVILLPLGAALGYALLGKPAALDPAATAAAPPEAGDGADHQADPQIAAMVERLAERLAAEPDNIQGWLMLAKSYQVLGRNDEAEQALANVDKLIGKLAAQLQKKPDDLQNGLLLATAYQTLGRKEDADKTYAAIEQRLADGLQKKPGEINDWLALINAYKGVGRYNAARKAYARIEAAIGDNPDLLIDYAETAAMANDRLLTGKPLDLVERVLKINPKHPDALILAGYGALEANDTKKAVAYWETALPLLEPGSEPEKTLRLHLGQLGVTPPAQAQAAPPPDHPAAAEAGPPGLSAEEQKQVDERIARLAARLKDNPDDTEGWLKLANAYKVLHRYDEAVKAYAGIESRIGDNPDLLVSYAEAIALANGRSMAGKPTQLIERALKLNPKSLDGLLLAGSAAMEAGDKKQAIAYWEAALPLVDPDSELAKNLRQNLEQLKQGQ